VLSGALRATFVTIQALLLTVYPGRSVE